MRAALDNLNLPNVALDYPVEVPEPKKALETFNCFIHPKLAGPEIMGQLRALYPSMFPAQSAEEANLSARMKKMKKEMKEKKEKKKEKKGGEQSDDDDDDFADLWPEEDYEMQPIWTLGKSGGRDPNVLAKERAAAYKAEGEQRGASLDDFLKQAQKKTGAAGSGNKRDGKKGEGDPAFNAVDSLLAEMEAESKAQGGGGPKPKLPKQRHLPVDMSKDPPSLDDILAETAKLNQALAGNQDAQARARADVDAVFTGTLKEGNDQKSAAAALAAATAEAKADSAAKAARAAASAANAAKSAAAAAAAEAQAQALAGAGAGAKARTDEESEKEEEEDAMSGGGLGLGSDDDLYGDMGSIGSDNISDGDTAADATSVTYTGPQSAAATTATTTTATTTTTTGGAAPKPGSSSVTADPGSTEAKGDSGERDSVDFNLDKFLDENVRLGWEHSFTSKKQLLLLSKIRKGVDAGSKLKRDQAKFLDPNAGVKPKSSP
jgi:hypothetical protein